MKCHISATVEAELLERAKKQARQTRRSLSNFIELALENALKEETSGKSVVTSRGRFQGQFSRSETYGSR